MLNSPKKKRDKSREKAMYHLLTITKVKILTLLMRLLNMFLLTFFFLLLLWLHHDDVYGTLLRTFHLDK